MGIASIAGRLLTLAWIGHRARMVVVSSLGAAALVGSFPGAALATSGVQCAASSTYGSTCIDVYGTGLQVTDIQGWMTTPSIGYLSGLSWRIDLERYNCDPIGKTKSACPVATVWHGNTKSGNPPKNGSICTSVNFGSTLTVQQCQDYGGLQVDAKNGYWPSFYSLPHTFGSGFWMCTELAIRNSSTGVWHYNAAGLPNGVRGCVQVHA